MVWTWVVRQETMSESWKHHSITVDAPGGGGVFLPGIIKSMNPDESFQACLYEMLHKFVSPQAPIKLSTCSY
jgi:hypothetical protein